MRMSSTNLVKVVSLNCRGLGDRNKRRDVFNYLKGKRAHIYCLLDTHFTHLIEEDVLKEWGGRGLFAYKSSSARGVAILFDVSAKFVVKIN